MSAAFNSLENARTLFLCLFLLFGIQISEKVQEIHASPVHAPNTLDQTSSDNYIPQYESYGYQQPISGRDLPPQTSSYDFDPPVLDDGWKWGNVVIVNKCNETFILTSVGGWRLSGPRNDSTGYGAKEELIQHHIAPGENYTEAFRNTYIAADEKPGYDPATDKLFGQGISMKLGWTNGPYVGNISQLEYARTIEAAVEPDKALTWCDVSEVDCGQRSDFNGTDLTATEEDYRRKTEWCPGYRRGMVLEFEPSEGANVTCEGFKCEGKCADMYMFDRTREGEPSKVCTGGFRGNMVWSLCGVSG